MSRSWIHAKFVLELTLERLVTVYLVFRHGLVGFAHADIGALHSALASVEARAAEDVALRNLRADNGLAVGTAHGKQRPYLGFHLFALFRHPTLQRLRVINTAYGVSRRLVYTEDDDAPAVLVGEAGQGIIQAFRRSFRGLFQFDILSLTAVFLCAHDQFFQLLRKHWRHSLCRSCNQYIRILRKYQSFHAN